MAWWSRAGTPFGALVTISLHSAPVRGHRIKAMSYRALASSTLVIALASALCAPGASAGGVLDVIFVLDNSGSMKKSDADFAIRSVVQRFAGELDARARVGVVAFDEGAELLLPLDPVSPSQTLGRTLQSIAYSGQLTNSPAGVERALYELRASGRADAERVIVFITDGLVDTGDRLRDVEKKRWLTEGLAGEARREEVRIFGIALTEAADVELIQALALATEGDYFRVASAADIRRVFGRIAEHLRVPRAVAEAPVPVVVTPPVGEGPAPLMPFVGFVAAFGLVVGLASIAYPFFAFRQRTAVSPPASASPSGLRASLPAPEELARPAVISSTGPQPVAKLVDVGKVSGGGLLPHDVEQRHTAIGRDSSNDVVIARDTISSFHATIDYRDGYFHVEDHRSTNGTYLNGNQLHENRPVQLKSGDRIDFSDYEFRFIIPDHEPRGMTAILESSSVPPEEPSELPGPAAGSGGLADADTRGSQAELFARPATLTPVEAFESCLHQHMEKIRGLGLAHRDFVDRNFDAGLEHALLRKAEEEIAECEARSEGRVAELSRSGVHYTLCVLPLDMEQAADWYQEVYGGYARFLVSQLDVWAAADRQCDVLCVISFGLADEPWISITIVPANEAASSIEVMSFEFLSEEERRRALSLEIVDVGGLDS